MNKTYDAQGNINKWNRVHWTVKRQAEDTLFAKISDVIFHLAMVAAGLATVYMLVIR